MNNRKSIVIGFIIAIIILLLLLLKYLATGYLFYQSPHENEAREVTAEEGLSIVEKIETNNEELIKIRNEKSDELKNKVFRIGIYGSDARGSENSRSDIIMILQYHPKTNDVVLISIPRDSRVNIPGKKVDKINHAFAFGGAELLNSTLEELFEMKLDYYMMFGFEDFTTIIDELGGVNINAEKDFGYHQTIVPKGEGLITGEQALFYVRYRSDNEGDFGRIRRQQEVFASLMEKLYQSDKKEIIPKLTKIYNESLHTNIELSKLENYYELLEDNLKINIDSYTLKTEGKIIDGIYYGEIDDASLAELKLLLK